MVETVTKLRTLDHKDEPNRFEAFERWCYASNTYKMITDCREDVFENFTDFSKDQEYTYTA